MLISRLKPFQFAVSMALAVMFAMCCTNATANTVDIYLVYVGDNALDENGVVLAQSGDSLAFDLVMDATNRPTLGGGFDINFDSGFFVFESFTFTGSGVPGANSEPESQDGRLFSGLFYTAFDEPVATIARIVFTANGSDTGTIFPSGTAGIGGPWIDRIDNVSIIEPNYEGVTVRIVPVPAAIWFLVSGLGVLLGLHRR